MRFNRCFCLLSALAAAGFWGGAAFASAKLPTVNVAKGSVSARELFGEQRKEQGQGTVKNVVAVAPVSVKPQAAAKKTQVAYNDVLTPMRPSGDLWARSDNTARAAGSTQKLRMPEPAEFATLSDDFILPEESLDFAFGDMNSSPAARSDDMFAAVRPGGAVRAKRQTAPAVRSAPLATRENYDAAGMRQETNQSSGKTPGPVIQNRFAPIPRAAIEKDDGEVIVRKMIVPMDGIKSTEARGQSTDDSFARADARSSSASRLSSSDDDVPLTKMSPMQLKRAFQKTYMSENKHLSAYKIDDRFDVASDMDYEMQGFDAAADFDERGGIRPLEIRLGFRGTDTALSRDNFNLLSEYAGIVVSNPKRAIQISIPEIGTRSFEGRRLAARRLAIIEQVLKDSGVSDQRIVPVLSSRADNSFVLRVISNDMFQTQTLSEYQYDIFGDKVKTKTYKSLSW